MRVSIPLGLPDSVGRSWWRARAYEPEVQVRFSGDRGDAEQGYDLDYIWRQVGPNAVGLRAK